MRKPRTYKQLQQDPRVEDWSDERSGGIYNEGLWIYLAPGWVTDEGLLTIHEDTVKQCCDCLVWARYSPEEWVAAQDLMFRQQPWLLPAG
ncbi:MAG: hypothetical protein CL959_01920 [Euryarchaeota archaeon]|nr:hypothetical protein [Euryarchaeota archaeon]|tara:strand:- start:127 stop:396 length:270 start_codon:yes stop_codon:yes gene_type:complete